jgi:mRNA interferase RelE/StbE
MTYRLTYHPEVKRTDLPKIDSRIRRIIKRAIEERLATRPEVYGKPLQRTLKGYWKLRVGDHRIVFEPSGKTVRILAIVHRKDVYHLIQKRTGS